MFGAVALYEHVDLLGTIGERRVDRCELLPFLGQHVLGKDPSTGHSGSHAPQSMHSSGSITYMRPTSWMQSTGQTSTQERSLISMHGSPIT
jgi:hypothetical protein